VENVWRPKILRMLKKIFGNILFVCGKKVDDGRTSFALRFKATFGVRS